VVHLKTTPLISAFSKNLGKFMPKYNELKHFNAEKIVDTGRQIISDIKFVSNAAIEYLERVSKKPLEDGE
jgi:hypothetical protein